MRPAIIRTVLAGALNILIVELPHRRRAHQGVERRGRYFAIVVVRSLQADDHVGLRLVVTEALNKTAAADVATFECFQIDRAAILYFNGFGTYFGGEQE